MLTFLGPSWILWGLSINFVSYVMCMNEEEENNEEKKNLRTLAT